MKIINLRRLIAASLVALGAFAFIACSVEASVNDGATAEVRLSKGYKEAPKDIPANGNGLYKYAEGYEMGPWNCWDNCGSTATTSDGADGGLRITAIHREHGQSYFGVNLAAGSDVGSNSDLDGKGFTQVEFKIRGAIPSKLIYFFFIDDGESIGDKDGGTDANGKPTFKTLNIYDSGNKYGESEWLTVTVPLNATASSYMSSAFTVGANDGFTKGSDWIEIKDIDWKDADGKSVVPAYK